ncbi:hypothetical protein I6A81_35425 [Frankia sp. CN7]|nr:hypothetical protein [Frankia nepalensis]
MPDVEAARTRLAAAQAELLAALVAGGPDPDGFDRAALAVTRRALLDKRLAGVARRWPALAAEPGFAEKFAAFAATRPPLGSHQDGLAFAGAHRAGLTGNARRELLLARAATRRFALLADRPGGRALVAVRAPGLGTRLLSFRLSLRTSPRAPGHDSDPA